MLLIYAWRSTGRSHNALQVSERHLEMFQTKCYSQKHSTYELQDVASQYRYVLVDSRVIHSFSIQL